MIMFQYLALDSGFYDMLGLANILYSSSIKDSLNSLSIISDPCSYVISVDLGYMVNHIFSTNFSIDIARLLPYYIILIHPVKNIL